MIKRLSVSAMLLVATVATAGAHVALKQSSPAVGGTVVTAPPAVTLTFSEPIEAAFSGATVVNASGQRFDTGARTGASRTELQISLKPLPPGTYKVNWHVLSVDTHKTQGSFSFTVGGR
jgi:methionine-rich copper-binding protein CopC